MTDPMVIEAWDAQRKCEYCDKVFRPKRPQDLKARFCQPNCRKNFFRYGAKMRIVTAIRRDFDKRLIALEKRVSKLEKKSIDNNSQTVVTLQQVTQ
jgi:hypothetical protein